MAKEDRPDCLTIECPGNLWSKGLSSTGKRRWYCKTCRHSFTENGDPNGGRPKGIRALTALEHRRLYTAKIENRRKDLETQRIRRAKKKLENQKKES